MKFTKGNIIRKNNFNLFRNGSPVEVIRNVIARGEQFYQINGVIYDKNYLTVISNEESNELLDRWNNLTIDSNPVEVKEFVHIREDNGKEKVGISFRDIKKILFSYQNRFPEKNIEAYMCPICNKFHLGKQISKLIISGEEGHEKSALIPTNKTNYINWLNIRIKKTEKELNEATDMHLKIGKGAKLKVYKECLNYINTH